MQISTSHKVHEVLKQTEDDMTVFWDTPMYHRIVEWVRFCSTTLIKVVVILAEFSSGEEKTQQQKQHISGLERFVDSNREWQVLQADLPSSSSVCQCFSVLGTKRKLLILAVGWLKHHLLPRVFIVCYCIPYILRCFICESLWLPFI